MGFREWLLAPLVGDQLVKAESSDVQPHTPGQLTLMGLAEEQAKSLFFDPFSIMDNLGYKERPTPISYGTMDLISKRVPALAAIIQLRCNQVAQGAKIQRSPYDLGSSIILRDSKKQPTQAERKKMMEMQTFLQHTGNRTNIHGVDNFETFLRKITRDALVYDQGCFEVVRDRAGRPAEFYAVDGASIRIADTSRTGLVTDPDEIRYVQVYDNVVVAEFTSRELCFGVRNPRTDLVISGYGMAEAEVALQLVTALLWGIEYNTRFFSQNGIPKGVFQFEGPMPESQLRAFRRHFFHLTRGTQNAFRPPILGGEAKLNYIDLQQNNKEMEFSEWLNFLLKYFCAVYQCDPAELNFVFGNTGQSSSLSGHSNEEKIKQSRDRGLRPLLETISRWVNEYLIWEIDPHFEFVFGGLDANSAEQDLESRNKRARTYQSQNEIRAEQDLPPRDDELGEIVLDPVWLDAWKHLRMEKQMQAGMAAGWGPPPGMPENGGEQADFGELDQAEKSLYKSVYDLEV